MSTGQHRSVRRLTFGVLWYESAVGEDLDFTDSMNLKAISPSVDVAIVRCGKQAAIA